MRTQTIVRLSKKCGIGAAVLLPLLLASGKAHAVTSCDASSFDCSVGSAAMKFESKQGLPTTIETPWFPSSGIVQVKAMVAINPVANGGPLFSIDMPKGAVLEASWPDKGFLTIKASNGDQSEGTLKVHHTLTPDVMVHVKVASFDQTFTFDADSLIQKIPGSHFNYDAQGQTAFTPWGFGAASAQVRGPDLQNSLLFSMGFDKLPSIVSDNLAGDFGISASTSPTFSYRTTKVSLSGADVQLADDHGTAKVPAIDGDFQEVYAQVEGAIAVSGELDLVPNVTVTRAGTFNINETLSYAVVKTPFTAPSQNVIFQSQLVHIPLPNVHVPEKAVDVGSAKVGGEASATATIQNSGEQGAKFTATSSDPQFTVDAAEVKVASKSGSDLKITFKPTGAGPATSTITIKSNDPDSPDQSFKVTANGGDPSADPKNAADDGAPTGNAGGCGCKTAGGSPVNGTSGGLAGLALVLGLAFRRRNKK
jgi:MYXO-CTERM domain-containing protein